jgi:predicted RNA-binding protein YlqC (UPF0109 family)
MRGLGLMICKGWAMEGAREGIRRFVYEAVRVLVDRPDDIVLEEHVEPAGIHIRLQVHPSDFGKVIGQGGSTFKPFACLSRQPVLVCTPATSWKRSTSARAFLSVLVRMY